MEKPDPGGGMESTILYPQKSNAWFGFSRY